MQELKMQIIGVIIAITLFGLMYTKAIHVFEDVWQQLENKIATQLGE